MRPQDEWVTHVDESLRIIPQDLWDRVQAQLTSRHYSGIRTGGAPGKFLLSGLLKCAVCGGSYAINNKFNYRCTAAKNRGATVCTNGHSVPRKAVERAVFAALTTHLYTPENLAALTGEVKALLRERTRQHEREQTPDDTATRLREVEAEIAHIKAAILVGKATKTLLEMLEEREREREALRRRHRADVTPDLQERLSAVLARLPELVAAAVADLETLLAADHLERGRDVIRALVTDIRLRPIPSNGQRQVEAEIRGDLSRVLYLTGTKVPQGGKQIRWLGEGAFTSSLSPQVPVFASVPVL